MHMCVNTLSPAQPSPYIILRLNICVSVQKESHHLAVAEICCYGKRSIPTLSETKRRKRNSYHPRSHQTRFKKATINIYTHTYKYIDLLYMNTHRHC